MMMLITYDVSTESQGGKRRLRRVARACRDDLAVISRFSAE